MSGCFFACMCVIDRLIVDLINVKFLYAIFVTFSSSLFSSSFFNIYLDIILLSLLPTDASCQHSTAELRWLASSYSRNSGLLVQAQLGSLGSDLLVALVDLRTGGLRGGGGGQFLAGCRSVRLG